MAQKLRGIRVDLCKAVISMDVLLSIQEMLKNNRGLEVLVMNVPQKYRKLFQRGVDIVPHALCLPMRSKVAFVSVVTVPTASSQSISHLDTGILSTIFAFAVPPQQRVVHFITDYFVADW
ncbi:hypothetical protein Poli38472_002529 [Pythium oligandrum]|uniref:Uncharacterized protein n=1 Tax=Pythium oligandrum TaxID=41045 RepID=A0A8K1CII6_PYTOL|nr:hypothetical protein Poli38472_002529 [Pythium oligandrum]|eukprot:TMW63588.1 hypothetical protein Poli38472_002529 [Pythium oligandrum]